jgi:hypothetical protein
MFRTLLSLGAGYFIYTKSGRQMAKNIAINAMPLIEKELGVEILKPIKELTKDPKHKEET